MDVSLSWGQLCLTPIFSFIKWQLFWILNITGLFFLCDFLVTKKKLTIFPANLLLQKFLFTKHLSPPLLWLKSVSCSANRGIISLSSKNYCKHLISFIYVIPPAEGLFHDILSWSHTAMSLIFIGALVLSCCSSICFRHGRDLILTWVAHTKPVTVLSGSKHSPCHLWGVGTCIIWYSRSNYDASNHMDDKETLRSFRHFRKIENMLSSSLLSLFFVTDI